MITLDKVTKTLEGVAVVDEFSLRVGAGHSLALLGPSGSGKTTLLRLIAGFEVPDQGTISLNGVVASQPSWVLAPHRRGVGMVFQRPALWPHLTVAGNILFGLGGWRSAEARSRLAEVIGLTRIAGLERRYPHQISGGEGQRVALARAIAPRPPILLLDEPLSGLDPELHRQMLELIAEIQEETAITMVYVSHNATEAMQVTSQMAMMRHGRLESDGPWPLTQDRATNGW
jgi:iron(III) transport system ATP-binding protein